LPVSITDLVSSSMNSGTPSARCKMRATTSSDSAVPPAARTIAAPCPRLRRLRVNAVT
jgi:hypothetical protein